MSVVKVYSATPSEVGVRHRSSRGFSPVDAAAIVKSTIARGVCYSPKSLVSAFSEKEVTKLVFQSKAKKPYSRRTGDQVHGALIIYTGNAPKPKRAGAEIPHINSFIVRLGSYNKPLRIPIPISSFITDQNKAQLVKEGVHIPDLDRLFLGEDGLNAIKYDMSVTLQANSSDHADIFRLGRIVDRISLEAWATVRSGHGMSDETAMSLYKPTINFAEDGVTPAVIDPDGNAPFPASGYMTAHANFYTPDIPLEGRSSGRVAAFSTTVYRRVKNEDPSFVSTPTSIRVDNEEGSFIDTKTTFRDLLNKEKRGVGNRFSLCVIVEGAWTKVESKKLPAFGSFFEASRFIIVDNVVQQSASGDLFAEEEDDATVERNLAAGYEAAVSRQPTEVEFDQIEAAPPMVSSAIASALEDAASFVEEVEDDLPAAESRAKRQAQSDPSDDAPEAKRPVEE